MKKINLSSKAKKSIIITGSALFCVAVAAIALTLSTGGVSATEPSSIAASRSSSTSLVVSIAPIIGDNSENDSQTPVFVPSSGASQSTQLTKIEKPTSAPPAPVVEGNTSTASNDKVTPPTNPALTDKSKKPSYTSKPTATSKPATSNNTKNGTVKDGKTYVDGFGWVDGTGAGGQGTTVEGDWGGGSQVGIMD